MIHPTACIAAGYDGWAAVPGCHNGRVSTDRAMTKAGSRAPNSWGMGDGQAIPWEYAPAPESRDVVTPQGAATGCSSAAASVTPSDGGTFASVDPATELPLARVAKATPADIDKAVGRAPRAPAGGRGRDLSGKERAKYLFRIARILQERSREFAVLESMDSGKPIKE